MTNTKLLLVVCGVSMMMNVSLVMNAGLASSSCTQQLQMSELNYKATLRQLENERKRQTGDSKCPTCQACPEEAGQVVEVNDEEQDQQDVKVAQVAQMGTDKNPPWVWLPGREIVDFHVWKPEGFKTDNTIYDPKEDAKLQELFSSDKNKYARSPIPMGSARIRVAPAKWITLDEFAFAHDVFFEEWQRFSFGNWLGVKCQQDPMDAFAIQDMLWRVKPDLLIEVGTNNGGGAIFYASIMQTYNPKGHVVTLDVKPVNQNWMTGKNKDNCKGCITGDEHPLWTNTDIIKFIQGDITTKPVQLQVEEYVKKAKTGVWEGGREGGAGKARDMDSFVADYEVEAKDRRKIPPGTGCSLRDWNDLCLGCRRPVQRKIAKGEVARHNKKGDMWMVLQGKVYDVTLFGKHHPAGEAILLPCAGKDATLMYNKFHAYVQIDPLLGAFCLGVLDPHATYEPPPPYQFRKSSESTAEKNGPTQDIPVPGARGEADPRAKGGSRFSAPLITASLPEKKGAEKAATGSFPPSLGLAPRKVSSFARAVNEPPAKPPLPWKPGEPLTQDIVSSSCSKDRLWTIIHGKVYDLTAFAKSHPGGPSILFKNGGKECGAEFDKIHSFSAKAQLADLYLGDLKTSPSALLTSSAWAPPPGGRAKGRPPPGSA
eukprot:gene20689-31880_t